jgi:hypothetical protein
MRTVVQILDRRRRLKAHLARPDRSERDAGRGHELAEICDLVLLAVAHEADLLTFLSSRRRRGRR